MGEILKHRIIVVAIILTSLLFWEILSNISDQTKFLMGSPVAIVETVVKDIQSKQLYVDVAYTGLATALGLFLGLVVGVVLAIVMWAFGGAQKVIQVFLTAFSYIPVFSLAPILTFWFGVGFAAKVMIAFLSCVLVCTSHAYSGIGMVSRGYTRLAEGLGASKKMLIRKVILPGSINSLSATTRTTASLALMGAFVAEFISSSAGLGHYILKATATYDMSRALFGVLILALIGYLLAEAAGLLIKYAIRFVDNPGA